MIPMWIEFGRLIMLRTKVFIMVEKTTI